MPSRKDRIMLVENVIRQGLASQIRANRLARDWSQAALAERCGMKPEAISRLEAGKSLPNLKTLERIASAFDIALIVQFVPFKSFGAPSFDDEEQP